MPNLTRNIVFSCYYFLGYCQQNQICCFCGHILSQLCMRLYDFHHHFLSKCLLFLIMESSVSTLQHHFQFWRRAPSFPLPVVAICYSPTTPAARTHRTKLIRDFFRDHFPWEGIYILCIKITRRYVKILSYDSDCSWNNLIVYLIIII